MSCSVGLQFKTNNKSFVRDGAQKDTPDVNFYVGKDSNNYKYGAPKSGKHFSIQYNKYIRVLFNINILFFIFF